jgi:hypothetical protein
MEPTREIAESRLQRFIAAINGIHTTTRQSVTGITAFFVTSSYKSMMTSRPRGGGHGHKTPIYLRNGSCDGGVRSD